MHILFVVENFFPKIGGVETLFYLLTKELCSKGHRVSVVTSGVNQYVPLTETLSSGVEVHRMRSPNRYIFTFFGIFKLLRHCKQVDIIHTTSYNAGLPAILAGMIFKKKVVITFHEFWGKLWYELPFISKPMLALHVLFERMLIKFPFHRFVAVSDYTLAKLREAGVPEKKSIRIYNGLKYSEFVQYADVKRLNIILFYGRLGVSKGLDLLIASIASIKDLKDFEFHLVVSEKNDVYFDHLLEIVEKNGLRDKIKFIDTMPFDYLKDYIRQSHAVIIPSYSEGFCFVANEAIALGTPVISSGRGALSEVIGGNFVEFAEFTKEGCAEAIEKAISNQWTVKPIQKFPVSETVENYELLYASILNSDV